MSQPDASLQSLAINTVRTLSMDAVQAAESGHPGTPMALAPLAYALYTRHVRHNPADPHWPDRDRVILSAGHASMLLYSTLYLSGYDLSLDEIKNFRQWGSKTPGHPEFGHTAGVETTTGPLGQGVGNAVGFAVAEAHLAALFNRDRHSVIDHYTWFIAGDGCLQEGISHEAASFAGHQKLGKLIGFFDDNRITIDGRTDLSCSDDVQKRFESYGWQVLHISDVNDQSQIDAAIADAKRDTERPTLVITRTIIGFGSPNRADTAKAHGEPLGKDEIKLTKAAYGWPSDEPFHVPTAALEHWRLAKERGVNMQAEWMRRFAEYAKAFPSEAKELGRRWHGDLPAGWEKSLPEFTSENGNVASRAASGSVINAIGPAVPELIGGSADLTGSNLTNVKNGGIFSATQRSGRNFHFGIREHAMGAVMNGMALHGGIIPYGGTFLVFADYMRPAIRLAALMRQQVIYVFTHDSIGLGEDGPTHQPIEHLGALRCIPNLLVLRPADAQETAEAWRTALKHRTGPSALVLTRQKLPLIDRSTHGAASGLAKGAYVLKDAPEGQSLKAVILATGSEVEVALKAQAELATKGIATRVVSMPSMELFAQQSKEYQASVLPEGVRRVAVEAAHPMSWHRWVGVDGAIVGIDGFGASAPAPKLFQEYGITAQAVVAAVTARA
ncbi:transketolase [Pseudogemmatithrix spongiicola]|uniref:Transketolase n=1 Tax=Pseudogemmatithrix spongiicola TaxID=3062599 RepID=A0AA49Q868_9BACT|nr:transketolase [Gemmatimonadaceae bacterium 'strain 138']WKW16513.1 transketolase [Gemmatimonadaceae bacterium 'strain 318']